MANGHDHFTHSTDSTQRDDMLVDTFQVCPRHRSSSSWTLSYLISSRSGSLVFRAINYRWSIFSAYCWETARPLVSEAEEVDVFSLDL